MEKQKNNKKCSLSEHEGTDAISYCHQCKIYMFTKCIFIRDYLNYIINLK